MSKVSVVIPNYNGLRYLDGVLQSLRAQTYGDLSVILVDNGSEDESVSHVRSAYPEVSLVCLPVNTGFCGAVNAGIAASDSDYVILLNNDTETEPDFVAELCKALERHPLAFSCQARLLRFSERDTIDDAGDLYCVLGWAFARGRGKPAADYDREEKVFACCAGAAIYRRSLLEETGLFDEEHFAYLEDMDIGYRARILGYENWFAPKAKVYHVGSGTTGSRYNQFKTRYSSRNNVYMIYKNMPPVQLLFNLPFLAAGFLIKLVFFTAKGLGREYAAGIVNGIRISRQHGRMSFSGKNIPHYLQIQLELYKNFAFFLLRR